MLVIVTPYNRAGADLVPPMRYHVDHRRVRCVVSAGQALALAAPRSPARPDKVLQRKSTLAPRGMIRVKRPFVIACLPIPLAGTCIAREADVERNDRSAAAYLDYSGRDDLLSGGVKLIPVETPKGTFQVWTKRIGNHPTMKVLLLHGGPAATHE
jgi:hypothetical protein